MTTREFIKLFNEGNYQLKASLVVSELKPEPDQHLIVDMPKDAPCETIHFLGYTHLRVGITYFSKGEKRLLGHAFRLYPRGMQTFNSWLKVCGNEKWGEGFRQLVTNAFDGLVMPEFVDN
jgi:hypothetical protein